MKHLWLLPLLLIGACGDDLDSPQGVVDAQVDAMNDLADVVRTIKDKSSAEAAKPKLEKISQRMKEAQAAMQKMKTDPDPATQQKMMAAINKAAQNLQQAFMGMPQDPEIMQVLDGIDLGR